MGCKLVQATGRSTVSQQTLLIHHRYCLMSTIPPNVENMVPAAKGGGAGIRLKLSPPLLFTGDANHRTYYLRKPVCPSLCLAV